jgi:hypothetical protein
LKKIFEEIDEETAYEIKEKAEQYYNEYGTLEDALREFKNEDEKEFARTTFNRVHTDYNHEQRTLNRN